MKQTVKRMFLCLKELLNFSQLLCLSKYQNPYPNHSLTTGLLIAPLSLKFGTAFFRPLRRKTPAIQLQTGWRTTRREFSSFDFRVHFVHSASWNRRLSVSHSRPQRPGGPKLFLISQSVSVRRRIPHEEAVVFDTRSCPWLSVDHDAGPGLRGCATGKSRWLCCAGRLSSRWANRQLDSEHGRCVSRCAR